MINKNHINHIIQEYRKENIRVRNSDAPKYFKDNFNLSEEEKDPCKVFPDISFHYMSDDEREKKKLAFDEGIDQKFKQAEKEIVKKVIGVETSFNELEINFESVKEEANVQMKECCQIISGLVAEAEENEYFDDLPGFSCPECDFVGKKMCGLKIHITKKHSKISSY